MAIKISILSETRNGQGRAVMTPPAGPAPVGDLPLGG